MSWIAALEAEIAAKRARLLELQAVIAESKDLMAEIEHLQAIHLSAQRPMTPAGPRRKSKAPKDQNAPKRGGRPPFTPEQREAAAERTRARWAAKRAAEGK